VAVLATGLVAAVLFSSAAIGGAMSDDTRSSSLAQQTCVWRSTPVSDPHPAFYDRLSSVAAVSPRTGWAVGDYFTGHEGGPHGAVIERWDGQRWSIAAETPSSQWATSESS
jgi:hypothetical protein